MRRTRSFTLIEILTVIAIISVLVGIVLGVAKYARSKAHISKTQSKMVALADALDNCRQDRGYYPSTDDKKTVQLGDYDDFEDKDGNTPSPYPTEISVMSTSSDWVLKKGEFRNTQTGGTYLEGYEGGKYVDAWGRPFLYRCDGDQHSKQTFDLSSAGRDGKIGNEDDVTNWQRN